MIFRGEPLTLKSMVKMSTQHQIMDSSLALGRLEIRSPAMSLEAGISGPVKEKNQEGAQTHLNGCVPLSHQVAGHKYGVDKVGILQHPDGTVLKQLQPPPRGPREMQFYQKVYAEDCCDPYLLDLQHHLPKYYGTWSSPDAPTDLYLKLEDLTRRFRRPCIMDVKIGQRSYDPFASQEKREQQIKKYPLMEEIGFLLLGMRIYQVSSDSYDTYDQHFGRSLVKETIRDGLAKFFDNGKSLRKDAIAASIQKVQKILQWFDGQSQLHFYASSLLFVYEGSPPPSAPKPTGGEPPEGTTAPKTCQSKGGDPECNNNVRATENGRVTATLGPRLSQIYALQKVGRGEHDNGPWRRTTQTSTERPIGNGTKARLEVGVWDGVRGDPEVEVRMIDFAHVFPSQTRDEGYVYGLKNLLSVLLQILSE